MLSCEQVTIAAGAFRLADASLQVPAGSYGVLMGATGSGKSSLLEVICGLRTPEAGTIHLGGRDITHLPIAARGIGYVPQDGAVFPRMTVRDNLGFGLMIRHQSQPEIDACVGPLAEQLSISHLLDRRAARLSGGEVQRVALGRALAVQPRLLLLDEPLSALDESTRGQMTDLLKRIQHERGITALHVTHSRSEAQTLADVLLKIDSGRIVDESVGNVVSPQPQSAAALKPSSC